MSAHATDSVQELDEIERTISFHDFRDDASPPPYAFPPGVLNGAYPREEAVFELSEQLRPTVETKIRR